ncbi:MAG: outer membrane lipoprotein-sorting protein [Nitrospiria bacterium]
MPNSTRLTIVTTALVLAVASSSAGAADVFVEEIVRHVMTQDNAIRDETARVVIRRVDDRGAERISTHRLYWKNLQGAKGLLGKTLLITVAPLDKRGEAFLLWQTARANDSQAWLYLPDLRQVRRLAISGHAEHQHGQDRDADLSLGFEQLGTRLTGLNGKLAGREVLDGVEYLIIEDRSTASDDLLPLRRFWISSADWTIGKIEYRDAAERLARTQRIVWERVDQAWVWTRTEIQPANASGKIIVDFRDIAVNTDLSDRVFTVETLKSGKVP